METGSYVSGLMCWRDLDVGVLVGSDFTPADVLNLAVSITEAVEVVGFTYRDEGALAHRLASDAMNDSTSRCKLCGKDVSGDSTSRCGGMTTTPTSPSGIGSFVTGSHRSSAGRYGGSRTTGVDVRSTPTKSAELTSTTPYSMTASATPSRSAGGWPAANHAQTSIPRDRRGKSTTL